MDSARSPAPGRNGQHTAAPSKPPDILGLKVMRITKPTFQSFMHVYTEDRDILGTRLEAEQIKDMRSSPGLLGAHPGPALQLPSQKFGNLFLGETFSAMVAIINESSQVAKNVRFKVELMTPRTSRLQLLPPLQVAQVDAGGSVERSFSHEVVDTADHTLIVSVSYCHASGEESLITKPISLSVIKPLDVKTKGRAVEEEGDILYEVQIENLMPTPFVLESFRFDPAEGCAVVPCNSTGAVDAQREGDNSVSVFGEHNCVKPRDTRQYLFRVTPSWPQPKKGKDGKMLPYCSVPLGKVGLTWLSAYGEKGRIQTPQLTLMVDRTTTLLAKPSVLPGVVTLEKPFKMTCTLKNMSAGKMVLRSMLPRQQEGGVLWTGISGTNLGELAPGGIKEVEFTLIPIKPGLQNVSGLRFFDFVSKHAFFMKNAQVFVQPEQEPLQTVTSMAWQPLQ